MRAVKKDRRFREASDGSLVYRRHLWRHELEILEKEIYDLCKQIRQGKCHPSLMDRLTCCCHKLMDLKIPMTSENYWKATCWFKLAYLFDFIGEPIKATECFKNLDVTLPQGAPWRINIQSGKTVSVTCFTKALTEVLKKHNWINPRGRSFYDGNELNNAAIYQLIKKGLLPSETKFIPGQGERTSIRIDLLPLYIFTSQFSLLPFGAWQQKALIERLSS